MEINLPVYLCRTSSGHVLAELSWTVVTFVLYMRGVIPLPYEQCVVSVQTADEGKRLCARDRKLMKLLGQLRELREAVRDCATIAAFNKFTILLGPSSNNPLEQYTVEFVWAAPDADHAETVLAEKQVNLAKRRVVQKLIEFQAGCDVRQLPRANVFLAISISAEAGERLEGAEGAPRVLDCFSFRDSFRWDTDTTQRVNKRAGRSEFRFRLVSQGVDPPRAAPPPTMPTDDNLLLAEEGEGLAVAQRDCVPDQMEGDGRCGAAASATVWLVSRRGIKGLPPG